MKYSACDSDCVGLISLNYSGED